MTVTDIDFSILDDVKTGDVLDLHFMPDATDDLIYVVALCNAGVLEASPGVLALVEAIRRSNDWGSGQNRSMIFKVGPKWNRDFFEGRMRRALESLEVKSI